LSISRRKRRRKLAFPDRRKGRKDRRFEKASKEREEEKEEEGEGEEFSSGLSEKSFDSKEEGEKEEEEMIYGEKLEREASAKEEEGEERECEELNGNFFEEVEDEEWIPSEKLVGRKSKRRVWESSREKRDFEQSGTEEVEEEEIVEGKEDESESDSEWSGDEVSRSAASRGAKLLTPPKILSKRGAVEDGLQRRRPMKKSSSLEEVVGDVGKGRRRKAKDKERFQEARWERVENLKKHRWTFSKVPDEKKKMLVDLPGRNNITRLAVFSLYFTDDFLSYLLERRESEMATYWSPSGYGLKVNLQIIKQVCEKED
jgi:hypothetical protein